MPHLKPQFHNLKENLHLIKQKTQLKIPLPNAMGDQLRLCAHLLCLRWRWAGILLELGWETKVGEVLRVSPWEKNSRRPHLGSGEVEDLPLHPIVLPPPSWVRLKKVASVLDASATQSAEDHLQLGWSCLTSRLHPCLPPAGISFWSVSSSVKSR